MKEAEKFGLSVRRRRRPDRQEARPRQLGGTFRTADVVGLDTMAHVIKTLQDNLGQDDPFFASYATPPVLADADRQGRARPEDRRRLLQEGRQGHPAPRPGQGRLRARRRQGRRRSSTRMLKKPPAERLKLLRDSTNPQAQFLWAILRDSFHYAAVHLGDIAETARDIDFAMRWGFGTKPGAVRAVAAGRLAAGGAMGEGRHRCRQGAQQRAAAGVGVRGRSRATAACTRPKARGAPSHAALTSPPRTLPVYARQPFRESVVGADAPTPLQGRHRGLHERRGPRLDARRRGADRQHHRQAAPDQPGGDRRAAEGGRARRERRTRAS